MATAACLACTIVAATPLERAPPGRRGGAHGGAAQQQPPSFLPLPDILTALPPPLEDFICFAFSYVCLMSFSNASSTPVPATPTTPRQRTLDARCVCCLHSDRAQRQSQLSLVPARLTVPATP